jgi:hypothetical protein
MSKGKRDRVVPAILLRDTEPNVFRSDSLHGSSSPCLGRNVIDAVEVIALRKIVIQPKGCDVLHRGGRKVGLKAAGDSACLRVDGSTQPHLGEVGVDQRLDGGIEQPRRNGNEALIAIAVGDGVVRNFRGRQSDARWHQRLGGIIQRGKIAGIQIRMHRPSIQNRYRLNRVVSFIGRKEPRFFEKGHRPANRATDIGDVEERGRKLRLKCVGNKVCLRDLVVQIPRRESGILIIVKRGAVIIGATALRGDPHVGDAAYSALKSLVKILISPTASSDG